jgi:hypothetical protein
VLAIGRYSSRDFHRQIPAEKAAVTRARPFIPGPIDRIIYKRVSTLRSAFTSDVEEHERANAA